MKGQKGDSIAEVAMQYNDGYSENILTFVNDIFTEEGGTHLSGFRSGLTRTINDYGRSAGIIKENEDNLSGEDVREGLTAVISVKVREPQFEGQTKRRLGNSEVAGLVNTAFGIATGAFAVISYNFYTNKIDNLTYAIDEIGFSIVQSFAATH